MGTALDLTGKKFGNFTAIERSNSRIVCGEVLWLFQCDCGNKTEHVGNRVKRGDIVSCGCSRRGIHEDTGRRLQMESYKRGAKVRGFKFDLTADEFNRITSGNCEYCDAAPSIRTRHGYSCLFNGIDRKDHTLGCSMNNCVPCCIKCNRMKGTLSTQEFLTQIKLISENL
jgi:hypothetical protein